MAEELDKGKAIKLTLAIVCLLAAGYLIAASQGWVPAFWASKPPPAPIKIDEKRQKELEKEIKEIEENPKQNAPG
ncbi:MAG: hypothetical protein U0638_15180 [Phycisphaerales bacterium]